MERREVISLSLRYGILLVIGITNLIFLDKGLFYQVFTPLTVYPAYGVFSLLYDDALLFGAETIFMKGYYATIAPACVAGSAYYLLLILNMTTPMSLKKRLGCVIYIFGAFLLLNLARIIIFGMLWTHGYKYFDFTHIATWYLGSTILVAVIWFSAILFFRIQEAPVITDIQTLFRDIRGKTYV